LIQTGDPARGTQPVNNPIFGSSYKKKKKKKNLCAAKETTNLYLKSVINTSRAFCGKY
jgi:hypothetical protein